MTKHILTLVEAYFDGELPGKELKKVETHLGECETCAAEYASLEALSARLQEAPLPTFSSPEHFAADVVLRLPRKEVTTVRSKILEISWWLAPVGLIFTWIFISTTNLISKMLTTANMFGLLDSASAELVSYFEADTTWSLILGQFDLIAGSNLQLAKIIESSMRTTLPQILWQVSIAILYLSWLAIWWSRKTRPRFQRVLES